VKVRLPLTLTLVTLGVLVALLCALSVSNKAQAANRSVACGSDLDNLTAADGGTTATTFILQAGCTFTVSKTVVLKNGDAMKCAQAPTFQELAINERPGEPHAPDSAYNPTAFCTVQGANGVDNVMARQGTVHLEGLNILGGTYTGVADSGKGLKDGSASDASTAYGLVIELTNNTTNPTALGITGSGIKCVDEAVIRHSYVHDTQGNGIWGDEGVKDTSRGIWHVNFNVVINNGKDGIRWEFDEPGVSNPGEALIEHNEVHGNTRTGVQARDAGTATIRDNIFGQQDSRIGVKASDSGRTDRYNLQGISITNNVLNADTVQGCQLPDSVVFCANNTP
jgi:hypothetical protein